MPFGWGEARQQYDQSYDDQGNPAPDNHPSFGMEALGGAAGFGAMKVFEDRQRKEGKPVSHQFAKELLAGFAGVEVDRLAQTKGEDFVDREEAKRRATQQAQSLYDDHYGGQGDQFDPNNMQPHQDMQDQFQGQQNSW